MDQLKQQLAVVLKHGFWIGSAIVLLGSVGVWYLATSKLAQENEDETRKLNGAVESVTQVRTAAHELTTFAKRRGISVVLVGHVTNDGQIAGPRVVEHMVDTVLYFEGERGHQFRILRAVKNRFGPADEIGVFEMTGRGLAEVTNPSELFLAGRGAPAPRGHRRAL